MKGGSLFYILTGVIAFALIFLPILATEAVIKRRDAKPARKYFSWLRWAASMALSFVAVAWLGVLLGAHSVLWIFVVLIGLGILTLSFAGFVVALLPPRDNPAAE